MLKKALLNNYHNMFIFLLIDSHKGSKGGTVVRALASHPSGPCLNPGADTICGLRLLLGLSLTPRGFSPDTPVFPSPQKPTLPNSNCIWNARTRWNEFIKLFRASWVNKLQFTIFYRNNLDWSGPDQPESWLKRQMFTGRVTEVDPI